MKLDSIQAYMFCSALPAANLAATTSQVSVFKVFSEKIADILTVPFVFLHLLTNGQSYDLINMITPYLYAVLIGFLIYAGVKIYKDGALVNKKKKVHQAIGVDYNFGLFITYMWFGTNSYYGVFTLC